MMKQLILAAIALATVALFSFNCQAQDRLWLNDSTYLDRSFHMATGPFDIQPFFDRNGMMWGQGEADNVGISFTKTDSAHKYIAPDDGYLFWIPTYEGKVNIHGIINKMGNVVIGSVWEKNTDEWDTIYGILKRGSYSSSQNTDVKISRHYEFKEAVESALGIDVTRDGYYEVWIRPDGTKYILQPPIEIK